MKKPLHTRRFVRSVCVGVLRAVLGIALSILVAFVQQLTASKPRRVRRAYLRRPYSYAPRYASSGTRIIHMGPTGGLVERF